MDHVRGNYHASHMVAFDMNQYLKAIVSGVFTVLSALAIYYGNSAWYPIAMTAVGALMVYLVPNAPSAPKQVPSNKPPFTGELC